MVANTTNSGDDLNASKMFDFRLEFIIIWILLRQLNQRVFIEEFSKRQNHLHTLEVRPVSKSFNNLNLIESI